MDTRKRISKIALIRVDSLSVKNIKHPLHICPPFALKYIQAFLCKNPSYKIELIDLSVEQFSFDELTRKQSSDFPDAVVIYSEILASGQSVKLASLFKESSNAFIIGIGPDVTFRPEEYVFPDSPFDAAIAGEADEETPLLIEKINSYVGASFKPPIYINKEPAIVTEPDKLPYPQYSKEELRKYPFIYPVRFNKRVNCGYIISARGCRHKCLFCSPRMRHSLGREVRIRDAVRIADEIEIRIKEGANFIYFADDNFTASEHHVVSVCREIKKRNLRIKWAAQARVDEVSRELLTTMKECGCEYLIFGVESGSDRISSLLNKTETKEVVWAERCRETFEMSRKTGIDTCALFIIGSPTETKLDIIDSIEFSKLLNPEMIKVHFFVPYPGSEFYSTVKDLIRKDTLSSAHHYARPVVNLSGLSTLELNKMRSEFYKSILLRPSFIFRHIGRYFSYYIHNSNHFFALLNGAIKVLISG